MGDVDVMVQKRDFRLAHRVLMENGYQFKFRSPLEEECIDLAERHGGAEYAVKLPGGELLWFELQWRPVAGRWIQPRQEPSADVLISRSVAIKGSRANLLSPEDNLLQVCLHTAKHSYVRAPGFRLHTDVDRIVCFCKIDWNLFLERVENLEVKTATFFSLALARDLVGTPVPSYVLTKLRPNSINIWLILSALLRVGLFEPNDRKWGKLGYIGFVCLLYDDLGGLVRGIFPSVKDIQEYYQEDRPIFIPWLYLRRILALIFRRTLVR